MRSEARGEGAPLHTGRGARRAVRLCAFLLATLVAAAPALAQGYDPMRRSTGQPATPAEPAPEGNPELGGLPDGPGAEDTFYLCSACHSIRMVTQQRLSDERWDYLWDWMIREQGMPEQDEAAREAILAYLKTHFSSER